MIFWIMVTSKKNKLGSGQLDFMSFKNLYISEALSGVTRVGRSAGGQV